MRRRDNGLRFNSSTPKGISSFQFARRSSLSAACQRSGYRSPVGLFCSPFTMARPFLHLWRTVEFYTCAEAGFVTATVPPCSTPPPLSHRGGDPPHIGDPRPQSHWYTPAEDAGYRTMCIKGPVIEAPAHFWSGGNPYFIPRESRSRPVHYYCCVPPACGGHSAS